MRAVGVPEPGGPDVLRIVELPVPEPGVDEVRIQVAAAAVNPTDTAFRQTGPPADAELPPPWIPGMEFAGRIDEVGSAVTSRFAVGQRVMAIVHPRRPLGGSYAQYVVVPADAVAPVPEGISDAEASTLPMNGLTVLSALQHLDLSPGQTLGVTGAAGAVGGYAVQLGKHAGLRVIADASERDEELVRSFGPDVVVRSSRDPQQETAAFRAVAPDGVDGLLDAAVLDAGALPIVKDGGALVTVRFWEGPSERGIRIHAVKVRDHLRDGASIADLAELVTANVLTLRVAQTYPAEEAAAAHERLQAGGTRGRLVLTF
ncbi:NADP-dependent oxidoreductase [Nakamurella leprariae]|uniref:NADP-dependent oxidoreductase n=1 Tax=Nakamurella leprariae TaxID=2803911 RepID=A0A939C319_9ACTN|nr:NADP-dependent oxidoreductase [Nakamurella leprariae]MBM9468924.1 NADP-dependent oxidoreductase [Nakamurella leprariae]